MKVDILHSLTVNFALGPGNELIHASCIVFYLFRQFKGSDEIQNFADARAAVTAVQLCAFLITVNFYGHMGAADSAFNILCGTDNGLAVKSGVEPGEKVVFIRMQLQ